MSTTVTAPIDSRREVFMIGLFSKVQKTRFAELCYCSRLTSLKRMSRNLKIVIGVASSGALITSLAGIPYEEIAVRLLAGIAAVAAVMNPALNLDSRIVQCAKAVLGYSTVRERLQRLLQDLKMSEMKQSHIARELEIHSFYDALAAISESVEDKAITEPAWTQAQEEFPSEHAWDVA